MRILSTAAALISPSPQASLRLSETLQSSSCPASISYSPGIISTGAIQLFIPSMISVNLDIAAPPVGMILPTLPSHWVDKFSDIASTFHMPLPVPRPSHTHLPASIIFSTSILASHRYRDGSFESPAVELLRITVFASLPDVKQ